MHYFCLLFQGNGSTHRGEIRQSGGGVGRNIADALGKLEAKPFLVSAIGKDQTGNYLLHDTLKHIDTRGVVRHDSCRTACYSAILDHNGECYFGVGDMNINDAITPELVENFLEQLHQSSLVVIDGNIPVPTIDYVLRVCRDAQIPVWFEPTDTRKAGKVFQSRYWTTLSFVSPNLNELQVMSQASGLFYSLNQFDSSEEDRIISEASFLARNLVEHIGAAIITLGRLGILFSCRHDRSHVARSTRN
ncbi:uncharacterized protein [Periplaneta americana]|uniref:uncharacterized protein isoform X2 n=1 Tax=Periplaneta americana TaxID=6978 RepID=UPI0037E7C9E9